MANHIELETIQHTAVVTLSRGKVNALNAEMMQELATALETLATDDRVHALVITGAGRAFAAGVDIAEMAPLDSAQMSVWVKQMHSVFSAFARFPKPTVAAINGFALGGGCELVCGADHRIAGSSAVLGQPEILLGIFPGAGGTQRLTALVGPAAAKEMIFTGRQVDAAEALRIGLVDEVVGDDQLRERALAWASHFDNAPLQALAAAKTAINQYVENDQRLGHEAQAFAELFGTPDQISGMRSFLTEGPGKARFGRAAE